MVMENYYYIVKGQLGRKSLLNKIKFLTCFLLGTF